MKSETQTEERTQNRRRLTDRDDNQVSAGEEERPAKWGKRIKRHKLPVTKNWRHKDPTASTGAERRILSQFCHGDRRQLDLSRDRVLTYTNVQSLYWTAETNTVSYVNFRKS